MSDPQTWGMHPGDYTYDGDDGEVFGIMALGINPQMKLGDGLVLLDDDENDIDGGDIEGITEGFSGPKGFAPASSTLTVRRWERFKISGDEGDETE